MGVPQIWSLLFSWACRDYSQLKVYWSKEILFKGGHSHTWQLVLVLIGGLSLWGFWHKCLHRPLKCPYDTAFGFSQKQMIQKEQSVSHRVFHVQPQKKCSSFPQYPFGLNESAIYHVGRDNTRVWIPGSIWILGTICWCLVGFLSSTD